MIGIPADEWSPVNLMPEEDVVEIFRWKCASFKFVFLKRTCMSNVRYYSSHRQQRMVLISATSVSDPTIPFPSQPRQEAMKRYEPSCRLPASLRPDLMVHSCFAGSLSRRRSVCAQILQRILASCRFKLSPHRDIPFRWPLVQDPMLHSTPYYRTHLSL